MDVGTLEARSDCPGRVVAIKYNLYITKGDGGARSHKVLRKLCRRALGETPPRPHVSRLRARGGGFMEAVRMAPAAELLISFLFFRGNKFGIFR